MNIVYAIWGIAMAIPMTIFFALGLTHLVLLIAAAITNGTVPDWAEKCNE